MSLLLRLLPLLLGIASLSLSSSPHSSIYVCPSSLPLHALPLHSPPSTRTANAGNTAPSLLLLLLLCSLTGATALLECLAFKATSHRDTLRISKEVCVSLLLTMYCSRTSVYCPHIDPCIPPASHTHSNAQ